MVVRGPPLPVKRLTNTWISIVWRAAVKATVPLSLIEATDKTTGPRLLVGKLLVVAMVAIGPPLPVKTPSPPASREPVQ